ncbi:MAG: hypothetical protein KAT77_01145 [Nanoarchaeota archaeon]|nr:hypothetical protein [Nanoarchaeota archaeon]
MRKKGFQLSISVLVMIIISIVILGLGIVLLNTFIKGSIETKNILDERTDAQLAALLETGERVAVPFNSATISRGGEKVLGVGMLNIDPDNPHDYSIVVEFSVADNDEVITDLDDWVFYDSDSRTLNSNEQWRLPMLFMVPKGGKSGNYVFNVIVNRDGNEYSVKKVYISVP